MNLQSIKTVRTLFSVMTLILIISCEKGDDLNGFVISGTYTGTLTSNLSSKTASKTNGIQAATVVVKSVGNQIEVHCLSKILT